MRKIFLKLLLATVFLIISSCKQKEAKEEIKETKEIPQPASFKEVEEFPSGTDMVMQKTYYPSGQVKAEGNLKNGLKTGVWYSFYENGLPWSETEFKDGVRHGLSVSWYKNGQKRYEGYFKDGVETGKWTYWDENGNVIQEIEYK